MPVESALVYRNPQKTVEAMAYLSGFARYSEQEHLRFPKDFEYHKHDGILFNDAGMFQPCSEYFLRLIDRFLTKNNIDFARRQAFPLANETFPTQINTLEHSKSDECTYMVQLRLIEAGIPALCITRKLDSNNHMTRCLVHWTGIRFTAPENEPRAHDPHRYDPTSRSRHQGGRGR